MDCCYNVDYDKYIKLTGTVKQSVKAGNPLEVVMVVKKAVVKKPCKKCGKIKCKC